MPSGVTHHQDKGEGVLGTIGLPSARISAIRETCRTGSDR
jgi:hypothetical protein